MTRPRRSTQSKTRPRQSTHAPPVEAMEPRVLLSNYLVTSLNDFGPGSLRQAIDQSNANPGPDTISFDVNGTIALTSGQLEIKDDLTIDGPGASALTIDGSGFSRVFMVDARVNATISGVTIADGHAPDGATGSAGTGTRPPGAGGTGTDGGAIYNLGILDLAGDVITRNTAGAGGAGGPPSMYSYRQPGGAGGPGGRGGAIYNTGHLNISTCAISTNAAGAGGVGDLGGGNGGAGGAIFSSGPVSIVNSTLSGNRAGSGGGDVRYLYTGMAVGLGAPGGAIYGTNSLTISNSTIDSNAGGSAGSGAPFVTFTPGGLAGGIYAGGTITMVATTVSNNFVPASYSPPNTSLPPSEGGGVLIKNHAVFVNCTITGNQAENGGGIYNVGDLTLTNDTVTANTGHLGSGVFGGGVWDNTIVAGNHGLNRPNDADVDGFVDATSANNIVGDGTDLFTLTSTNGNQIGTATKPIRPMLSPLDNYGGPTLTMPPLPGSPAIDAGNNALAVGQDGMPLAADQRGLPRVVDDTQTGTPTVDIGAVEAGSPLPERFTSPLTVSDPADRLDAQPFTAPLTLLDAVAIADQFNGPVVIQFAAGLGPIVLAQPLELSNTGGRITIQGPGPGSLSISAEFQIDRGVTVEMDNLRITGSGTLASGVLNEGNLTLGNDLLDGNHGQAGGAVFNSGVLNVTNSTFSGNVASAQGGAIYNDGSGMMFLANCTLAANQSAGDGGGIYNLGMLTLANCTITGNSSTGGAGGGLDLAGGLASAYNSIIALNQGADIAGALDNNYALGTSGFTGPAPSSNNLIGVAPKLSALGNYGGPTPAMPPLAGSPAVDAGSNALAFGPDGKPLTTDQRGLPRIVGATGAGVPTVDIGAVEVPPAPIAGGSTLIVADASDQPDPINLTLREAVAMANQSSAPITIEFAPGISSITVMSPIELTNTSAQITIAGPGPSALSLSVGFVVDSGVTAEMDGLHVVGPGNFNSGVAGVLNSGNLTLNRDFFEKCGHGNMGGAIENSGRLSISNSTFSNNAAPSMGTFISLGGAIYNHAGATLGLTNCTLTGNSASSGGGAIHNLGTLTLMLCTLVDNSGNGDELDLAGGLASSYDSVFGSSVSSQTANIAGKLDEDYTIAETRYTLGGPSSGNLVADGTGGLPVGTNGQPLNGNILGQDFNDITLKLAPLGNYGGPTPTMPPLPGSPVIDAGRNVWAIGPDGKPLAFDQRGLPRISNKTVDIGASELQQLTSGLIASAAGPAIHFSAPVKLLPGAISLSTSAGTVALFRQSTLDRQTYVLSSGASAPDGRYTLTVHANDVIGPGGLSLSQDQTYPISLLFGDFDGTGTVNNADYFQFSKAFGKRSSDPGFLSFFDFNDDGVINNADYFQFHKRFGMSV